MALLVPSVRWVRAIVAAACLFPLVQACGGRSDTEDYLFGSDGTITQGASASVGGTRNGGGGGTRNGAGNSGVGGHGVAGNNEGATSSIGGTGIVTAGSSAVGGSTSVGGAVPVGGTGIVAGAGGVATAGTTGVAGAGGNPSGPPITCGAQTCDGNKQICCAGFGGFSCLAKNKTCNGATLACTTSADCAGNDVCCISITGDADAASSCKARCNNMGGGRDRQLCETDNDCQMPFRFCSATVFGVSICTRRP